MRDFLPILGWLPAYSRDDAAGDLNAGLITAIMLVPQSMAYALLAGLPPEVGLYSSILPLILYGIFGTSRTLAVGPVALVSLMVASTLNQVAAEMPERLGEVPVLLALLVGLISLTMGLVRVGFVVNFISHHVISGFTSAAALIIGFSQLKHILGIDIPRSHNVVVIAQTAFENVASVNTASLTIGIGAIGVLYLFRGSLASLLGRAGVSDPLVAVASRGGPLFVVFAATLAVYIFGLHEARGVAIVGHIPEGFPALSFPAIDWALAEMVLPAALLISFVGFLESVSVAKALASRRRQKIEPNQELIGLGFANMAASLSGGYPVTGGFSRSSVNFQSGARTPAASFVTAAIVALTTLFLTPLFHHLPKAVLAAIIIVAVLGLVDVKSPVTAWRYSKADAAALAITFIAVFVFGIEIGILIGIAVSIGLFLWRASRPHVAIVGRVPGTEHFRNYLRHEVTLSNTVATVRIDESLFFANAVWLENWMLAFVADHREARHFVLICAAINFIDGSALETLERLDEQLESAGVTLHLAEVKGPVMDRLQAIGFADRLGASRFHLSTHAAMIALEKGG